MDAVIPHVEDIPRSVFLSFAVWAFPPNNPAGFPGPDDVTFIIDVPALLVYGENSFVWGAPEDDAAHYPNSPDVLPVTVPGVGHYVLHHLNRADVHTLLDAWLDERGL